MNIQFFIHRAYKGKKRKTGDPYTSHLYAVKNILKEAGVHAEYILDAALLHDILEDTNFTKEYLAFRFGKKIADLVSVVSKIEHWNTSYCRMKSNLDYMEHSWKIHPEAIVIKMADRLHNLKTIYGFRNEKKKEYIGETENFLIPLFQKFLQEIDLGILKNPANNLLLQIENEVQDIQKRFFSLRKQAL